MKKNIIRKIKAVLCITVMITTSVIYAGTYTGPAYGAPDGGDEVELPEPYDYISFDEGKGLNGKYSSGFWGVKRLSNNSFIDIGLTQNVYSDDAISGKSLHFDGSFGLTYRYGLETSSYTFGYWIKPEVIETYVPTLILVKSEFAADEFLSVTLSTGTLSPDAWSHIMEPEDVRHSTGIENGLIANEWIYVTICVNGDISPDDNHCALDLYLNGYHMASGLAPKDLLPGYRSIWFGINIWDNPYRGYLDEFVMFGSCLNEEQVKALFLKYGGTPNAKNPLDNEPPTPGNNGGVWDEPYEWDILEPNYTTLIDKFQVNGFIRPKPAANTGDGSSAENISPEDALFKTGNTSKVKMFLPENSEYTLNVYYCIGVLLFLVGGVLLLAVYKKNKNRY